MWCRALLRAVLLAAESITPAKAWATLVEEAEVEVAADKVDARGVLSEEEESKAIKATLPRNARAQKRSKTCR